MIVIVLIPVAIIVKLLVWPFERPVELTPEEVAKYLRDFIEGTGGDWDFDDFVSAPITNERLDSIRQRAMDLPLPATDDALAVLRALLAEAESLASK